MIEYHGKLNCGDCSVLTFLCESRRGCGEGRFCCRGDGGLWGLLVEWRFWLWGVVCEGDSR